MSTNHTPGPWMVRQAGSSLFVVDSEMTRCIVDIGSTLTEADARLIAAAPTMLMVLQDSADELPCSSRPREQAGMVNDCDCWSCDRVEIMRAVIALATKGK